jgi:putative membrane-bound dehydrogenase-like protein
MRHFALLALLVSFATLSSTRADDDPNVNIPANDSGSLPVDEAGNPLNLDFETGTLDNWTVEGEAFTQQPIEGPISANRPFGEDKRSQHTGDYWIGGYEKLLDPPTGTLTSDAFIVTERWASFLVGGGSSYETRIELVDAETDQPFYMVSGRDLEEMQPVVVDLINRQGKAIRIRIVDEHTGGWGHVNFDDFRLHAERPSFQLPELEPRRLTVVGNPYPHAGLPPEEAAAAMQLPPGFKVQVAAAEPDVKQPIAMAIDDRGRLWVAEAYEYPIRAEQGTGTDRILIFEDTDLDGTLDSRKVFIEGLNLISGMELGFGGVWVGAAPYLMFIPDADGDDVPDAAIENPQPRDQLQFPDDVPPGAIVLLDGWGWHDTHETLNSFIWGPDGWLYGCHGVFTHSQVGRPGTPVEERVPINAGIWRYHPTRHVFEVYAEGTSNPWGVDFDEYGNCFATACVIPHLYHIIPGGRYQRQAGEHFNPFTYADIQTIARHRHYVGNQWNQDDRFASDEMGGGHAHAGAMIYLGGRQGQPAPEWEVLSAHASDEGWVVPEAPDFGWPEEFHGKLFMSNIHGNRINVDQLIPGGSGFAGDRYPDFLLTGDGWSQMLYMTYGPDGSVYVIDWYDGNQCHRNEVEVHDRSNGRIYKISYGEPQSVRVDLQQLSESELFRLATQGENEWYVRHARRILQERGEQIGDPGSLGLASALMASDLSAARLISLLRSADPNTAYWGASSDSNDYLHLRIATAWIHLDTYEREGAAEDQDVIRKLAQLASEDPSPEVRLAIASVTGRLPLEHRWNILEALVSHPEDAADQNLPLMYWYAMEPLADVDPQRALALGMLAGESIPMLRDFMIRRLGSGDPQQSLELLIGGLADADDDAVRITFLKGIHGVLRGREGLAAPDAWAELQEKFLNPGTTSQHFDVYLYSLGIATHFGDEAATDRLKQIVVDESGALEERRLVLSFLLDAKADGLDAIITTLLQGTTLRSDALRAAAVLDDPVIGAGIVESYDILSETERRDAVATLASRLSYANLLLDAVRDNQIASRDLSADVIRQLRNLNDEALNVRIGEVWGVVRDTPEDRARLIEHYRALIESEDLSEPDIMLGRAVFSRTCQKCHTLYATGGKVGPDITGANRRDLNYLLTNICDPSAVMAKEYQPSVLALIDGRIVTGIIKGEEGATTTVQTADQLLSIATDDIDDQVQSTESMMPNDLLTPLTDHEVRSLFAYVSGSGQNAMLATPDNVTGFFNGIDLTGWVVQNEPTDDVNHRGHWTVENGEIVGISTGLDHNEFLMSELAVEDFELTLEVLLKDDAGNSGIQFRSVPLGDGEMRGYQADVGPGWWGKLYEEQGRALLHDQDYSSIVNLGEWNEYRIVAVGPRVRTFINGHPCVDLVDPEGARRGVIALQLHSGGPTEVRFRNLSLRLLDAVPGDLSGAAATPVGYPVSAGGAAETEITWRKIELDNVFRSEGAGVADFDNDGDIDIVAGSRWYEQGDGEWTTHVLTEEAHEFDPAGYGDTFMNFPHDVNADGLVDVIIVDFPGQPTWWFENPGDTENVWPMHEITPVTNNESPQFVDVTGDGERELVCAWENGFFGFVTPQSHPEALWTKNPVSLPGSPGTDMFSHGCGAGDVNGDGRVDLVVTAGWWEQPDVDLSSTWLFHPAPLGEDCSHMQVFDYDADGDADILSASAHGYGIWWHEQQPDEQWVTHEIYNSFSETHAVCSADINGDGLPDIVTGKRWWSHGGHGPGGGEAPVLFWFEFSRVDGVPTWTPHQIDDESGIGTQFEVADVNADGLLDIITSNKRGTFLFEQTRE